MAQIERCRRIYLRATFTRRSLLKVLGCFTVGICMGGALSLRAEDAYPESSVKAVYLYRFAGYVQWPTKVPSSSTFTVAVLDSEDVADALERLLPDHPISSRPARVFRVRDLQDLGEAQMLYIGDRFRGDLQALISRLSSQPILIVTDHADGLASGSAINFVSVDRRVRFEISVSAAARSGLTISAQLLAVALRVRTGSLQNKQMPNLAHRGDASSTQQNPAHY